MKKQQTSNKKPTKQQVLKKKKTTTKQELNLENMQVLPRSWNWTTNLNQNSTNSTIHKQAGKASLWTERRASGFWDTESIAR